MAEPGLKKSDYSIIRTLPDETPRPGEQGMQPVAIDVCKNDDCEPFPDIYRLNYAKVITIRHGVKVKDIDVVHPGCIDALDHQFGDVSRSNVRPTDADTPPPPGDGTGDSGVDSQRRMRLKKGLPNLLRRGSDSDDATG